MTIPEGSNLNLNVRNNNNIVWKNIAVLEPSGNRIGYVSIGNIMKSVTLNKLSFTSPSRNAEQKPRSILEWGIVEVDLGKTLFKRWRDGGSVGEGIAAVGGTKIKVSWPNAWIGNLKLRPNELGTISLQFAPIKTQIKNYSTFFFDIAQYICYRKREEVLGGQRFIIKSIP